MVVTKDQMQNVADYMNKLEKKVTEYIQEPDLRKRYSGRLMGAMRVLRELELLDEFDILVDDNEFDTWVVKEGAE